MIGLMMLAAVVDPRCLELVDPYEIAGNVIKNAAAARSIGSAYIVARFDEAALKRQLPLNVIEQANGTWAVNGTLPDLPGQISIGGVSHMLFCKQNGRLLRFTESR